MKPNVTNQEINLLDSARLGFELGFLISGLKISNDEKEAWLKILQHASPEQLTAIHETLEHSLLMESTKDVDEVYGARLRQLMKEYENNQAKLENETIGELTALEKELETKTGGILI